MNTTPDQPALYEYTDIAALLDGTLTMPEPELLTRLDGHSILYGAAVNGLFGEAESGKTWIALCAIVEELRSPSGRALFLDLDHNGAPSVVKRLIDLGASSDSLTDTARFRYAAPDDSLEVHRILNDCDLWKPTIVVIDSVGELVPMFRGDSNSGDDYTGVHRRTATRLAKTGACVILIDHVAKSSESASKGAVGAGAKRRAIDGAYLRVSLRRSFTPGKGGSSVIAVNKDRHGGVRAHAHLDEGSKEPVAGIFEMGHSNDGLTWQVRAPLAGERTADDQAPLADVAALSRLDPPPGTVRDVKDRMGWGSVRASTALRGFRAGEHLMFPVPGEPQENEERADRTDAFPVPHPLPPPNKEHADQHKQACVPRAFPEERHSLTGAAR
ncbi:recombinase RecA [Gordonia sp. (in: high G+C Gram-positive bacteria)]|uniref:recombinase RecA n=1 Tax=Gordonia sp. (in: high G+C Gram-positive bacteria) TaxID=84139 RepID=UPI003342342F